MSYFDITRLLAPKLLSCPNMTICQLFYFSLMQEKGINNDVDKLIWSWHVGTVLTYTMSDMANKIMTNNRSMTVLFIWPWLQTEHDISSQLFDWVFGADLLPNWILNLTMPPLDVNRLWYDSNNIIKFVPLNVVHYAWPRIF